MKVELRVHALSGMPDPVGAHAMCWSYLLDAVFADAYHRRFASLRVVLPSEALADEVAQRAEATPARPDDAGRGIAHLCGGWAEADGMPDYHLTFGRLAPRELRASNGATVRRSGEEISVYTWQARLWGVPIRLAAAARRPEAQDRALAAMRRAFARAGHTTAYYHLHLAAPTLRPEDGGRP